MPLQKKDIENQVGDVRSVSAVRLCLTVSIWEMGVKGWGGGWRGDTRLCRPCIRFEL